MEIETNFDNNQLNKHRTQIAKNTQLLGMLLHCGLCNTHLTIKNTTKAKPSADLTIWECKNHKNSINIPESVAIQKIIKDLFDFIEGNPDLQNLGIDEIKFKIYLQQADLEKATNTLFILIERIIVNKDSISIIWKQI